MDNNLNLFNTEELDLNNSQSYTELHISSLQPPISDNDKDDIGERETEIKKYISNNNDNDSTKKNIFYFIKINDIKKLEQILKNDFSQTNLTNEDGLTPLHFSVIIGNLEAVNLLLKNNVDPNILSINEKQTPLHLAYLYKTKNSTEIINLLIKYNADQNILDIHLKKPYEYIKTNITNNKIDFNQNSYSSSYSITINQSPSTQRNKNNSNSSKKNNKINLEDIITPIKYPCLKKYKEDSYSINDSLDVILKNEEENNVTQFQNNNIYQEFIKIYNDKINSEKKLTCSTVKNNDTNNSNIDRICQEILSKKNSLMNSNKISTATESDCIGYITESKKILINKKNNNINIIENFSDSSKKKNGCNTEYSTTDIISSKIKLNNLKYNNNKCVTEFNYIDNFSDIDEKQKINLTEVNEYFNKFQEEKNNLTNKTSSNSLKNWLNQIGLLNYYQNFISNNINDINILINKIKIDQKYNNFDFMRHLLNIQKPGHCLRVLIKLESDAGLIDDKIKNFFIEDQNNDIYNNNLHISISQNYCFDCCCIKNMKSVKKNDLRFFLTRYDLMNLYSNFVYNGFDNLNFVILQMYSSYIINDEMLINYFHIYDGVQRDILLNAFAAELKKINYFLNSKEYDNYDNKDKIKYSNIFFDVSENYKEYHNWKYEDDRKNNDGCGIF